MKVLKYIKHIFVYGTDVWHFVLGVASGLLFAATKYITIAAVIVYLLYQHFEHEDVYESIKDMVVFETGLLLGLLITL